MTQEEKQLLLIDLCGRLPYNFTYCYCNAPLAEGRPIILTPVVISNLMNATDDLVLKPYLRPMNSMTKEEEKELVAFHCVNIFPIIMNSCLTIQNENKMFDWLNAHYFDYRGLIEKGLALEAPEGMYTKNNKTMSSWNFYPADRFPSYEEYVAYLKEKGLALEAPKDVQYKNTRL